MQRCRAHRVSKGRSLSLDLTVLFDVDVVVGLEDADFVIRELDTRTISWAMALCGGTYVKPLIKVNSCLISPPSDLAFSLAFWSSSGEAFSLRVT